MRRKILFLPILATLMLAGCSTDDDLTTGGNENEGKTGYIAVNIVQPKTIMGRVATTNDFKDGSEVENYAQTGLFFIFSADGNTMIGDPQTLSLTGNTSGSNINPAVERIYNAVLVVDGKEEANKPTANLQIVCVLNAPSGLESVTKLSELRQKIENYDAHTEGTFIMTNSVYKDGDKEVLGATVDEKNIAQSADEALANPVQIYVERVVAKIRAVAKLKSDGEFDNQGAEINMGNDTKQLKINITGIEIANIAKTSYLFKNIDGITYDWAWDVNNKRSYWEIVPTTEQDLGYKNQSYNDIVNNSPKEGENGAFDITKVTNYVEYIQPNTSNQKTAVLVTAELQDMEGKPYDFVYLRGGYFTPNDALTLIAERAAKEGYWKKTGDSPVKYSQLSSEDFEWEDIHDNPSLTWLKSYEVVAKVKSNITDLYKYDKNNNKYVKQNDVTAINTWLAGSADDHSNVARYYKDGKCYYFVNIDQTPVAESNGFTQTEPAAKFEGVVRNHIYDLTLNSIKGIGTPVFDPMDVIIPERPDDENLYYLAAQINVLAWRLVNQTVDFE